MATLVEDARLDEWRAEFDAAARPALRTRFPDDWLERNS
jgi:hypothetical protein